MKCTIFCLLSIAVTAITAAAELPTGVDPGDRLLQAGCLDVTKAPYLADPTGVKDATQAIQRAVNDARDHDLVCFFPEGTYLISDTISCEQQVRKLDAPRFVEGGKRADYWHLNHQIVMIGSTKGMKRPLLKLSKDAKGFDDPSKPKICVYVWAHTWYGDGTGEQPNISFNHVFKGINIDVRGHAGAIGIRHSGSQGSTLQDSTIYAEGAYASMNNCCGQGGGTYNIEVLGGQYGIVIEPSSRFPILTACVFEGQTKAAITYSKGGSQVPTLLVGCRIEPAGSCAVDFTTQRAYAGINMVDCVIAMKQGSVIARTTKSENIYIEDAYVRGAESVCNGGTKLPASDVWTRIGRYSSHSNQAVNLLNGVQSTGEIVEWKPAQAEPSYEPIRRRHYGRGPSFEDEDAVNVKSFGAKGNGTSDDTKAFEKAIAAHDKIFVPKGDYRLSGALRLGRNTHLFGLARTYTSIGGSGFGKGRGPGGDEGDAFSIATVDDADAAPGLSFLSVRGRIDWRSGQGTSMLASGSLAVSGHGGGRFYGVMAMGRPLVLREIRQPTSFYALNVERVLSNPQSEIKDCSHIRVYYFKVEAGTIDRPNAGDGNTPCRISDSRDVRVYCMYGNVRQLGDRPMLDVVNSDGVVVSQLKAFQPGSFPHLTETCGETRSEIPSAKICALFVRDSKAARLPHLSSVGLRQRKKTWFLR
jgi:hypothetical protein